MPDLSAVLKIGGSLAKKPNSLIRLAKVLVDLAKTKNILIVPGGGAFADNVRLYYQKFNLSEESAHKMAILAMDQYGYLLHDIIKVAKLIFNPYEYFDKKGIKILLPSKIMFNQNFPEQSWRTTSDSISSFIALLIKSTRLILVKSVDGIFIDQLGCNPKQIINTISARELKITNRCVDEQLPKILEKSNLDCYIVNGRYPYRIKKILDNERSIYTKIIP